LTVLESVFGQGDLFEWQAEFGGKYQIKK